MILKKKVELLEQTERRRKSAKLIKFIVLVVFYSLALFALWKAYEYVTKEIPNMVNKEINNTTSDLSNKIKEMWPFK